MPIEIKELIIRAVITKEGAAAPAPPPVDDPDAIVAACVKQVLKILKQAQER